MFVIRNGVKMVRNQIKKILINDNLFPATWWQWNFVQLYREYMVKTELKMFVKTIIVSMVKIW